MNHDELKALKPIVLELRSMFPDASDDALLSKATEIYIATVKPVQEAIVQQDEARNDRLVQQRAEADRRFQEMLFRFQLTRRGTGL